MKWRLSGKFPVIRSEWNSIFKVYRIWRSQRSSKHKKERKAKQNNETKQRNKYVFVVCFNFVFPGKFTRKPRLHALDPDFHVDY